MDDTARNKIVSELGRYKDWPKPGVGFVDFFPLFRNPATVRLLISSMAAEIRSFDPSIKAVLGLEARGFVLGPILALELDAAFVPVRKQGKLPGVCAKLDYALEYGSATIEVQRDGVAAGTKAVICDDLLATGGTLAAACTIAKEVGFDVRACIVCIDIAALQGAAKIPVPVFAVLRE
jgi:adenine phosphoribosyltransferase